MYVGSSDGMERRIVANESDLPYYGLAAAAVRGRNPLQLLRNGVTIAQGTREAATLLREMQPAAILGTGGYVCVPLFLAARAAGIPTIIYLPDVVPGLAVQATAHLASKVCCNVEDAVPRIAALRGGKKPLQVTGYPVRPEFFTQTRAECRAAFGLDDALPVLLVYGGSRGARSINRAIATLLPHLLPLAHIIHVCGREGDATWLHTAAADLPPALHARYHLYPYLEQGSTTTMVRALGAADVTVCRAGASVLAELPAAALPAVLVPYPYVHQDENADYLVRHMAAVKIADDAMLGDGDPADAPLLRDLRQLLTEPDLRAAMAQQARSLARPDAAATLAGALCDLARQRSTV